MPEQRKPPTDAVYDAVDLKVLPLPDNFFDLLQVIREQPHMYIGRKSIRDFRAWLDGYQFARVQAKLPPLPDEGEFYGFDAFVCAKYRWHDVGGWAAKIGYYYRDEALALDEFFKLLDEYRAEKQHNSRRGKRRQ